MTQQNNMENQEKIFAEGLRYEIPEKAPEWIKGKLSIKVPDFIKFLEQNQSNAGWVNIDLKVSKGGKAYAELNTWKPTTKSAQEQQSANEPIIDPATGMDVTEQPF